MVRHGRTAWNSQHRYQGHTDVDLDPTGRRQAAGAADALADLPVASVTSSDLRRAYDTAVAVAAPHRLTVRVEPALREVDLGRWEGHTAQTAAAEFPDEFARWSAGEDIARGGGETRAAAGRRAAPAVLVEVARVARLSGAAAGVAGAAGPAGVTGAAPAVPAVPAQRPAAVVVAHGYVLQAILDALAARGAVPAVAGGYPHLDNGAWLDLCVVLPTGPPTA